VRPAAWTVLIGVVAGPRRVTATREGTDQNEDRQQSDHAADDSRACAASQCVDHRSARLARCDGAGGGVFSWLTLIGMRPLPSHLRHLSALTVNQRFRVLARVFKISVLASSPPSAECRQFRSPAEQKTRRPTAPGFLLVEPHKRADKRRDGQRRDKPFVTLHVGLYAGRCVSTPYPSW